MSTRRRASSGGPVEARRSSGRRGGLDWRSRRRLLFVIVAFTIAFAIIAVRLVVIEVGGSPYRRFAANQDQRTIVVPAVRSSILAANGDELALTELRPTIFADPGEITDPSRTAILLAPVLHESAATVDQLLTRPTTHVVLVQAASDAATAEVRSLGLAGIGVTDEPVRYHPDQSLASSLLGYVDAAGNGASGLEYQWNRVLSGSPGSLTEVVDPRGDPIPGNPKRERAAVQGSDILTTINPVLQYQTDQALRKAVTADHAASATALVMDRSSGDLLAVADITAAPGGTTVQSPTAAAFTDVYEPGSVAKLVTVAGALNDNVITPTERFTIPSALPVAGTLIHDAEPHPSEDLSVTGILAQSSNIGAAEIAQRLGPSSLYHYEQAFGFTHPTAVHFPGESGGIVPTPANFTGTTLATMAYGEAQAVTAAQVVAAYNTIANGGVYVAPRLVTATVGLHGNEHPVPAPPSRRVVTSRVARELTPMFEQVVSSGTGVSAKVPSYTVAGKTGTSNVIETSGKYSSSVTDSTFAGYYPAQDPALTEVVVMNGSVLYGAEASAPAFSTIAADALDDLGIPSAGPQPAPEVTAVPTIDGQVQEALLGQ
jgi:cell division protein FtsI (penicillin-binding protein 3)